MLEISIPGSVTREVLVEAAYQAIRLIKHRLGPSKVSDLASLENISLEVTDAGARLAAKIVKEIEREERASIESLDNDKASEYINTLADIAHQRSLAELGYDEARGRELLQGLRHAERL